MVRAPCCEKMGLKKGPWMPEEDQILVSYIQRYGHGNWRALPRQAGLLRCGKSCRLRWMNYLRPDIKRGNFSKEEEDTIINLHQLLGNRWSTIAARLPGRTDNEIKNVWHTHLKKRVTPSSPTTPQTKKKARSDAMADMLESKSLTTTTPLQVDPVDCKDASCSIPTSPPQSCSEFSSTATDVSSTTTRVSYCTESSEELMKMDESFWSEALSLTWDDSVHTTTSLDCTTPDGSFPFDNIVGGGGIRRGGESFHMDACVGEDDVDFWLKMLMQAGGGLQELSSF